MHSIPGSTKSFRDHEDFSELTKKEVTVVRENIMEIGLSDDASWSVLLCFWDGLQIAGQWL